MTTKQKKEKAVKKAEAEVVDTKVEATETFDLSAVESRFAELKGSDDIAELKALMVDIKDNYRDVDDTDQADALFGDIEDEVSLINKQRAMAEKADAIAVEADMKSGDAVKRASLESKKANITPTTFESKNWDKDHSAYKEAYMVWLAGGNEELMIDPERYQRFYKVQSDHYEAKGEGGKMILSGDGAAKLLPTEIGESFNYVSQLRGFVGDCQIVPKNTINDIFDTEWKGDPDGRVMDPRGILTADEGADTEIGIDQKSIKVSKYLTKRVPLNMRVVRDGEYDIETNVLSLLNESVLRGVSNQVVNGDGTGFNQRGIVAAINEANSGAQITTTAAKATFTKANFTALQKSVRDAKYGNGKYYSNGGPLELVKTFDDGTGNRLAFYDPRTEDLSVRGRDWVLDENFGELGTGGATTLIYGPAGLCRFYPVESIELIRYQSGHGDNQGQSFNIVAVVYFAFHARGVRAFNSIKLAA